MGDERDENKPGLGDSAEADAVEGVRLVNKAEAEQAVQSGRAITRQSAAGGRLISLVGYESDEPEPTWADTTESSSMRILGPSERVSASLRMPETSRPTVSTPTTRIDDDFDLLDIRAADESRQEEPEAPRPERNDQGPLVIPDTGQHQLPHWTEAPSGETPIFGSGGNGESGSKSDEPTRQWSLDELSDASRLGSDVDGEDELDAAFAALGEAVDPRPDPLPSKESAKAAEEESDKAEPAKAEPEPQHFKTEKESPADDSSKHAHTPIETIEEKVESLKKASIVTRSGTAIVAAALAIAAFAAGPAWAMVLALVVVMLAAVEYFDALRRVGYRPATALGLLAVAGAMLGTYARGEAAIPLVLGLATGFTFLWYMTGVIRENPTANIAATMLGVIWTGIFGAYAALILRAPNHEGLAFLGGAVILVIAYDTFAYLGGVLMGRHKLIPSISPGKTWEGLLVATAATVVMGAIVIPFIHPWGIWDGIVLGIVVAAVAPLGDLAESMVKRDLGLKDMGRLLPGHGGVFDRFDALLFVLPATYYVCRMLDLI